MLSVSLTTASIAWTLYVSLAFFSMRSQTENLLKSIGPRTSTTVPISMAFAILDKMN